MAEKRRSSRFRLPTWLQSKPTSAERPTRRPGVAPPLAPPSPPGQTSPEAQPSPPSTERTRSRVTPKPVSPPSRESAQPQDASPPSTERTRSRVTPKPVSPPSRASAQPQDASQDTSPSREAAESQSAAQPPSPSRAPPQLQAETQQPSQADPQTQSPPPNLASQPSVQTSSLPPPSPSLTATKAQSSPGEAVTQPPLPSENLQPMTRPLPFPPSTEPISSVSEQEPKPARSEPQSQELQPKAETASENVLNVQNQTQSQMTFQPNEMPAEHSEASVRVTEPPQTSTTAEDLPVLTQKSDSSSVSSETKSLPESDGHPGQDIEGKEILQKDGSKEKITGVTEILSAASRSEVATQQKQLEKEEIIGKKETPSNSSSHGKEDQTVILNLRDKATVSESCHEPNISNGEKAPLQKEIRDDISKFLHGMATHQQKLPLGERPAVVVTLAGENRGASMQLGSESAKREETVHIHRGYKINPDESSTDEEMISEGRRSQDSKTGEDEESKAYINSNVQGINNSIMFNCSIKERDPGVQLALTHDLTEPFKPNSNRSMESPETRNAGVIVTTAHKLTYEPTVRRRCLRGLFLEPSDSDPNNPEKPRRHGCRYACKGKSKDNETDVL
ncbi:uncharacterized protein LOC131331021 [Rhododendron vialii]|uniref:uncharacterized protein LOC131331021 n=1 Tax=Rhododendron vialii TaxID=182163 RepID=UPI00265DCD2B|nr:uncharacterized protein LOC131331021 [Rhododendron vialii]